MQAGAQLSAAAQLPPHQAPVAGVAERAPTSRPASSSRRASRDSVDPFEAALSRYHAGAQASRQGTSSRRASREQLDGAFDAVLPRYHGGGLPGVGSRLPSGRLLGSLTPKTPASSPKLHGQPTFEITTMKRGGGKGGHDANHDGSTNVWEYVCMY